MDLDRTPFIHSFTCHIFSATQKASRTQHYPPTPHFPTVLLPPTVPAVGRASWRCFWRRIHRIASVHRGGRIGGRRRMRWSGSRTESTSNCQRRRPASGCMSAWGTGCAHTRRRRSRQADQPRSGRPASTAAPRLTFRCRPRHGLVAVHCTGPATRSECSMRRTARRRCRARRGDSCPETATSCHTNLFNRGTGKQVEGGGICGGGGRVDRVDRVRERERERERQSDLSQDLKARGVRAEGGTGGMGAGKREGRKGERASERAIRRQGDSATGRQCLWFAGVCTPTHSLA